jgi:hypothetical protein
VRRSWWCPIAVLVLASVLAACGAKEKHAPRVGPPGTIALSFEDDLGAAFSLERLEVSLDGKVVLACGQQGAALDARSPVPLYEGSAGPGEHALLLRLVYRGHGSGIFSYLQGYTFDVKSTREIDLPPAGLRAVHAIAHESGGPMTPVEDRPHVRFEEVSAAERVTGPSGCPGAQEEGVSR